MITFVKTVGDTAILRAVVGKESKCITSITGTDGFDLDEFFNLVSDSKDIKHAKFELSYCENEKDIVEFLERNNKSVDRTIHSSKKEIKTEELEENEDCDNDCSKCGYYAEEQDDEQDFTCPQCGSDEGLVDKNGHIHPCLNCIKTDIGLQMENKYRKMHKKGKEDD